MVGDREIFLQNLREKKYDIIVIGAGVIGANITYLASLLGFKVLLIDKNDFCSGSSSKTSKLLSGFWDEKYNYNIVNIIRLLKEREKIIKQTSTNIIPVFIPTYEYKNRDMWSTRFNIMMYESLSFFNKRPKHKVYKKEDTINYFPTLINNDLTGSIKYYENMIDDVRYTLELIFEAKKLGSDVVNYLELTAFDYDSKNIKKIIAADKFTRKVYEIEANNIVLTAGAYSPQIANLLPSMNYKENISYKKGTQIFLNAKLANINYSLMLKSINKKPNLSIIPWKLDTVIIGRSEKNYNKETNGDRRCVYATSDEVEYLLDIYNIYFNNTLNEHNIITTQSGIYVDNKYNFNIVGHPIYNLFLIEGGSFTMAHFIAEKLLKKMSKDTSKRIKKIDFNVYKSHKKDFVLSADSGNFLNNYYGYSDIVYRVDNICEKNNLLAECISYDKPIPKALIYYFIKEEQAQSLDDIMSRRLRFILTENDCGTLVAEQIANEMGSILGWNENRKEQEIKHYRAEIKRNRVSLF